MNTGILSFLFAVKALMDVIGILNSKVISALRTEVVKTSWKMRFVRRILCLKP